MVVGSGILKMERKENMNFKKEYDVEIPENSTGRCRRSKEYLEILEFLQSKHESMKLVYDNKESAKKRRQSLAVTVKREKIPVYLLIRDRAVYVIKK